jgi:hypothetical protein
MLLNALMDLSGASYAEDRSLNLPLPSPCHAASAVVMSCTCSETNVRENDRTYQVGQAMIIRNISTRKM